MRENLKIALPASFITVLILGWWLGLWVGLVLALVLSFYLARELDRPLNRIIEIVSRMAGGELVQDVRRGSAFGLGRLEEELETAGKNLAKTINKLSADRRQIGAVLSSMAEGVLATDRNGRIILANPAVEKMFEVIEPEIIGKTIREAIFNNEIAELFEEAVRSGRPVEREIETVTPVAGIFLAHASPMDATGVVCVIFDIGEIRKLEKYRSEFVANVSHELKTPLTAIRNYVETLLDGAINDQENNKKFLGKIEKHAVNLSALIDDILELSRLEAKKELSPFVKVDLTEVVKRSVETVSGKARKKNIKLEVACAGEAQLVDGIEEHLYRAILNLLDNAVNYTAEGGVVSVSCQPANGKIEVIVSDNGSGIPPEHLPRLFERFYRVDQARSRELGGTGLGLAIVKHVMNLHNGTVDVESEVGKGSKFILTFP
jgi:two-component system phosphate regulon sensor histidine kinase PhoR